MKWTRYGPLAVGGTTILLSAWEISKNNEAPSSSVFSASLFTLGVLLIGAWLAIEIYYLWAGHQPYKREEEESEPE